MSKFYFPGWISKKESELIKQSRREKEERRINMNYWVVLINRSGCVSYGVSEEFYLAGIFYSRKRAEAYSKSDKIKQFVSKLNTRNCIEEAYPDIDVRVAEFDPTSEKGPLMVGSATYYE